MKEFSFGIIPYTIINNSIFIYVSKSSSISSYGFIKGKQELNESIVDTVIREVKEEINLDIHSSFLEKYFLQHSKKKDIGVFLIDICNIDFSLLSLNHEIYSFELLKLDSDLFNNFCSNQKFILNDLFLYFKNKNLFIKQFFY